MSRKRIYQWYYHVHLESGSWARISLCSITWWGQFEFWDSTFFRNTNLIKVTHFKETVGLGNMCVDNMISLWGATWWPISASFIFRVIAKKGAGSQIVMAKKKLCRDQEMKRENFQESQGNVQVGGSRTQQVNHRLRFQLLQFFFFASEKNQYV